MNGLVLTFEYIPLSILALNLIIAVVSFLIRDVSS